MGGREGGRDRRISQPNFPHTHTHTHTHTHVTQAQEKEKVNEGHIGRQQSTIDRMLKESNDRLKTNLSERKQLLDERVREGKGGGEEGEGI